MFRCSKELLDRHNDLHMACLSRYKVFAVELDVLKPPVDELELVGFVRRHMRVARLRW